MAIIFELLGELLLQVLGEVFIEVGLHSLAEPFRKAPNPWLPAFGYLVFGAVAGAKPCCASTKFCMGMCLRWPSG